MSDRQQLESLADSYGVQTWYTDIFGQHQTPSDEALMHVLRSLGAHLASIHDVENAHRERTRTIWKRVLEPVIISWDGNATETRVRLPADDAHGRYRIRVHEDNGRIRESEGELGDLHEVGGAHVDGTRFVERVLPIPGQFDTGYHQCTVQLPRGEHQAHLISAPTRAYVHPPTWGVFLPAYALHSGRSIGGGDLRDLDNLVSWSGELGGGVVGTLPLLAAFLDHPFEPSPYAPVSRMFWNELLLDLGRLPELAHVPAAQERLSSVEFARETAELRRLPEIDYRRQMALKRSVLELLSRHAFDGGTDNTSLNEYLASHPHATDYARFRAATEHRREVWRLWPERMQNGDVREEDFTRDAYHYHLYVQWRVSEQFEELCSRGRKYGPGMYLDMPLGVHPDGYDNWRERSAFLEGNSAGAPPDALFTKGQDWGFRPLHPEGIREQGYRYLVDCLRHQLGLAGVLRIDHVMGLHRVFCVPHGMGAKQGLYIKYRPEEFYAVLSVESHRHKSMIVGEDLGTVPPEVPEAMDRHAIQRLWVLEYELQPNQDHNLRHISSGAVASVNTHDMPPFKGFFDGMDITDQLDLKLIEPHEEPHAREHRRAMCDALAAYLRRQGRLGENNDAESILAAALANMAASDARIVLINLEDLWMENRPQNVPGTGPERPNWRRKARLSMEELRENPAVNEILQNVNRLRRNRGAGD